MKLRAQQGYISLKRKPAKKDRSSKVQPNLRAANGANKVPWGW
jgi:hypothetical protein